MPTIIYFHIYTFTLLHIDILMSLHSCPSLVINMSLYPSVEHQFYTTSTFFHTILMWFHNTTSSQNRIPHNIFITSYLRVHTFKSVFHYNFHYKSLQKCRMTNIQHNTLDKLLQNTFQNMWTPETSFSTHLDCVMPLLQNNMDTRIVNNLT